MDQPVLTLTPNATRQIRALRDQQHADGKPLRVSVESGGCSGMQYGMAFDDKKPDDRVVAQDGVEVAVDPVSAGYLQGSVIDYADSLQGSGFQIKNPNVQSTCGCGRSFQ